MRPPLPATTCRHAPSSSSGQHGSYLMLYNTAAACVEHLFVAHSPELAAWWVEGGLRGLAGGRSCWWAVRRTGPGTRRRPAGRDGLRRVASLACQAPAPAVRAAGTCSSPAPSTAAAAAAAAAPTGSDGWRRPPPPAPPASSSCATRWWRPRQGAGMAWRAGVCCVVAAPADA